jgi:hypothetical protein
LPQAAGRKVYVLEDPDVGAVLWREGTPWGGDGDREDGVDVTNSMS